MPNKDMVKGAEPVGRVERAEVYVAQSVIYKGDFVKKNAAGTVERAAASDALVGVALSNAAAAEEVLVADHPEQLFMIQSDSADIDAQADIGLNYNVVVATANTTYKRSGMELDGSTGATDSTLPLRLVRIAKDADNELGANVKCIVKINRHQNSTAVEGV
jgi:hypothetical protein